MSKIRLSPKYGVNPSLLICPICGEETGELALFGRINDKTRHADIEAPKHMASDNPCKKCQKLLDDGYKALLECADGSQQKGIPERTGRYAMLKGGPLENYPDKICYCKHSLFEKLISQIQNNTENG